MDESNVNTNEVPENAGKPWTEEDLMILASYVPTKPNAKIVGKLLGRTPRAIQYMWCKLYWPSSKLLEHAERDPRIKEHYDKIINIRKKMQIIFI